MNIIPAIDLLGGRCVRLSQGRYDMVTVYSEHPEDVARRFQEDGAGLIHIVDLDGAREGSPVNLPVIERIARAVTIGIEVGGGIRDVATARRYAETGVGRIILGTKACVTPSFLGTACREVAAEIIAGIDAKDGKVALKGWTEISDTTAVDLARELETQGAAGIIYTDISKDGMRTGPNVEATLAIARSVSIPVIVSGGVSSDDDILGLLPHEKDGIWGVIVGRAIYEGDVELKRVLAKMGAKG